MNWKMYYLSFRLQKIYSANLSKIAVISFAISYVYFSGFEQVFTCKETIYVKVGNLYKRWKLTLQIIFFFFEWVVITIR